MLHSHEWKKLLEVVSKCQDASMLNDLFELLFTLSEQEELEKRITTIRALLEGQLSQREIAQKYQISIAKITRGSNALKTISPELEEFLKKCLTV